MNLPFPSDAVKWLRAEEQERVALMARVASTKEIVSLRQTDLPTYATEAGAVPGDYYSMGDYWWPDPESSDGLPYIRRDGESNPDNFDEHRLVLRKMKDTVAALVAGYLLEEEAYFAQRAGKQLEAFFVTAETRMNPHLCFAQAIPGVTQGRGIGIIDTLHLIEIVPALEVIEEVLPADLVSSIRNWFSQYLNWMLSHPNGLEEARMSNNHSVAYWLQVAAFARAVGDEAVIEKARQKLINWMLPDQMAADGSFPRELERTKPYGYSIFQLDNVTLLTEILSKPRDNFWAFSLPDGRCLARALNFLYPFIKDKRSWPYEADIAHFESWPVRGAAFLLGGIRLDRQDYLSLWKRLESDPIDLEVRRNVAMTQPVLWIRN